MGMGNQRNTDQKRDASSGSGSGSGRGRGGSLDGGSLDGVGAIWGRPEIHHAGDDYPGAVWQGADVTRASSRHSSVQSLRECGLVSGSVPIACRGCYVGCSLAETARQRLPTADSVYAFAKAVYNRQAASLLGALQGLFQLCLRPVIFNSLYDLMLSGTTPHRALSPCICSSRGLRPPAPAPTMGSKSARLHTDEALFIPLFSLRYATGEAFRVSGICAGLAYQRLSFPRVPPGRRSGRRYGISKRSKHRTSSRATHLIPNRPAYPRKPVGHYSKA
jgi:hypothetical protein